MFLLALQALATPGPPQALRCEYQKDPLCVTTQAPRLSWQMNDLERGARQQAYQIQVSRGPHALMTAADPGWDSGRVESDRSVHVAYDGPAMPSGGRYRWRVRTWDVENAVSPWSEPAFWEMGPMGPEDWQARWIGVAARHDLARDMALGDWLWHPESEGTGVRVFFRGNVQVDDKPVEHAFFKVSATGDYRVYVNGRRIGRNAACETVNAHDGAAYVVPGRNLLAIECLQRTPLAGITFGLRVTYLDGSETVLASGADWRCTAEPGPRDWRSPEYDDAGWAEVRVLGGYGDQPWGTRELTTEGRSHYVRGTCLIQKPVLSARARVSGLGLYELWINGQRVGDDTLTPGWTHFRKRVQFQTYDVTRHLRQGTNAVGAILGNGWWGSYMAGNWKDGPLRFMCQLDITFEDGTQGRFVTNETWKAHPSPITYDSIYHGEHYDARLEQPGWVGPGFDDAAWEAVTVISDAPGRLVAQSSPAMAVTDVLRPVAVTEPTPGVYVFDFGQNHAGRPRLTVSGDHGDLIRLRTAEILNEDGTVYRYNLNSARSTDFYTLRGEGTEVYAPRFTYHGYRYVEVTGYPGAPDEDSLESQVIGNAVAPAGRFECSNPLLNQVQHSILWGQRSNLHSVPTDCPQRDERLGWTGDAQVFAPTSCWNMDMASFYSKWMHDITDSQRPEAPMNNINPVLDGTKIASPGWGDAVAIMPWTVYLFYGDTRIIEESYPGAKLWVEYMRGQAEAGLLYKRSGYSDWVAVEPSPKEPIGAAYYYHSVQLLSAMARVIGRRADARVYGLLAERIAAAFNETYLDEDGDHPGGTQTANALPLSFGITPAGRRAQVVENIVADIRAHDMHLTTGFLGTAHLLPVLSAYGAHDTAYAVAAQETCPSLGYMVRNGGTTIWERWNGDQVGKQSADANMNSFNHFAFGAIGQWFYEDLAGLNVDPSEPGFKHTIVRPRPVADLDWASAEYDSPYGVVASAWRVEDNALLLEVRIPANTHATIHVPNPGGGAVFEGETPAADAAGLAARGTADGFTVFEAGAGEYRFRVPEFAR